MRHVGAFAYTDRVHPCPKCLALIDVPPTGGAARCGCGWMRVVKPRDETPLARAVSASEAQRLAQLAASEDPTYLPAHEAIARCGGKSTLDGDESLAVWQRVYASTIDAPHDPGNAIALVHFTTGFLNSFAQMRGTRFARAVLEAALDLAADRRSRQDLACCLGRGAARERDLESAERWIAPCDPAPRSLSEDTTYRLTRAIVALQSGQPQAALALVGRTEGEVPIGSRSIIGATLVRAHALEMLGREREAVAALRAEMRKRDPGGQVMLENNAIWHPMIPCARTLPTASIEHLAAHLGNESVQVLAGTGMRAVAFFVLALAALPLAIGFASGETMIFLAVPMMGVMAVVFFVMGQRRKPLEERGRRVRKNGIPGRARIRSLQATGPVINDLAIYWADAELHQDGAPPRPVGFEIFRRERRHQRNRWIMPWSWIPVRVDPDDPTFVVPDLGERPPEK